LPAQLVHHSNFSPEDLHHFHRVVSGSLNVRNHFDLLMWLQGDMQRYLPHDILIVAWGDFDKGDLHHDVISAMPGVRSINADAKDINALMAALYCKWASDGKQQPLRLNHTDGSLQAYGSDLQSMMGAALHKMRSGLAHGLVDQRSSQNCLYVTLSGNATAADIGFNAMTRVLPYIDMALRQVSHLPYQLPESTESDKNAQANLAQDFGLSDRELEVLQWVAAGKTNPEIGAILDLSEFTIKNHLKRIFVKLNVINRAQAVSRFQSLLPHV
jgi:transcriptional regulator EpsA